MKTKQSLPPAPRHTAFTLVELMVAMAIASLMMVAVYGVFVWSGKMTRAGNSQVKFMNMARSAEQKIVKRIRGCRTVVAKSPWMLEMTRPQGSSLIVARMAYLDRDGNPGTVNDNVIVYYPNIDTTNIFEDLCTCVTPIEGATNIFSISRLSPSSARFMFHVGDSTNASSASFSGTGLGYQGVEVRFSATPRNLQAWFNL